MQLTQIFSSGTERMLNSKRKYLFASIMVFAVLLLTAVYLSANLLNNPRVYNGVYLDGIHAGGLDKGNLLEYLQANYNQDLSTKEIQIYHKNYSVKVSFEEISARVHAEAMANRVYQVGRTGNIFKRLLTIMNLQKNPAYIKTEVTLNLSAVEKYIDEIDSRTYVEPISPSLILLENEVYLQSGVSGYKVDRKLLLERIVEQVQSQKSGIVVVPVKQVLPAKVDTDSFYQQIVRDPQDATLQIVNGELQITPEIIGRSLDKATLLSSIAKLEARNSGNYPMEIKLPVKFIQPQKTAKNMKENLFSSILSQYSTSFTQNTKNDQNRAVNIRLATEAMNGIILLPGESFSFNEAIGKRSKDAGYQLANIYTADGITTGVGGGICQVSSTLFNAALEANLQIDERHPHIYTVSYVPLGRDAAVSYNTQDLKFTNTSGWPIKIEATVTRDGNINITIHGTNENPALTVVIQTTVLKTIPYTTTVKEDISVKSGKVLEQAGMNGAVVDTFFGLKNNQSVVSSYKIFSTTYNPLPEIYRVPPESKP